MSDIPTYEEWFDGSPHAQILHQVLEAKENEIASKISDYESKLDGCKNQLIERRETKEAQAAEIEAKTLELDKRSYENYEQAKEIEKYKRLANKNGRDVCEKRNIISQQAKEIEDLNNEVTFLKQSRLERDQEIERLKRLLKEIHDHAHHYIDWDEPSSLVELIDENMELSK